MIHDTGAGPAPGQAAEPAPGPEPGLPPGLAAAWGLHERPGKGPRPGLSLEQIVAAAIQVGSANGLAAVSMSRVAAELGAGTMALYRYVSSKRELIELMVDAAFGPPPALPEAVTAWRPAMSRWAWTQRAAMQANSWAVLAPISGPPIGPNSVAWVEQGLECLRPTGLDEAQKMSVILLVAGYARNQVTMEAQLGESLRAAGATDQQAMQDYGRILGRLLDPRRFPELTGVVAAGVLSKADDLADEFAFGLERILDGIGVLADSLEQPG